MKATVGQRGPATEARFPEADLAFHKPSFQPPKSRASLGSIPDEIDGGHCIALSRPNELAERLDAYRAGKAAA